MRVGMWLTGLSIGSLVLVGMIAAGPLTGSAQQQTTEPAQAVQWQTSGDDDQDNGTQIIGTPLLQPTIDLVRAQEIALESQAGAAVTEVDLEGEDGVLTYSVGLDSGIEVKIDATSGEITKSIQHDEDEDAENGDDDDNEGEDDAEEEQG